MESGGKIMFAPQDTQIMEHWKIVSIYIVRISYISSMWNKFGQVEICGEKIINPREVITNII